MTSKTYWEKLKDPRWQKRRLEVMQREKFSCQECGEEASTLNVHHKIYRKGASPWEYADHELACLCETCHEAEHNLDNKIKEAMAFVGTDVKQEILGVLHAHMIDRCLVDKVEAEGFEYAVGFAHVLFISFHDVFDMTVNGEIAAADVAELASRRRVGGGE